MPNTSQPVTPDQISEHPLETKFREMFWALNQIIEFDFDRKNKGVLFDAHGVFQEALCIAKLKAIRSEMQTALETIPTETTPLIASILPALHAATTLILVSGEDDVALDLLMDLKKRLAPSPVPAHASIV
jgi:hypothetical protein